MFSKRLVEMGVTGLVIGLIVTVGLLASDMGPLTRPQQPTDAGLFTAAQAARGRAVYEDACAACHGTTLTGGAAPPLTGRRFEASWSHPKVTLDDMLFIQRTTMPPRAAGDVAPDDHVAVFAYVLQMNGYSAGDAPLRLGAPALQQAPRWAGQHASTTEGGETLGAGALATVAPDFVAGDEGAAPASTGPDQAALDAAARSTDWPIYTHDYAGTRHSPLDKINASNAANLVPACVFQVGERDNFQTGPLVYRGTMYITTWMSTIALDARRLVVTVGKDGILRTLDRATQEVLYETPVTTIENADVPITTTPTRACPGVLGGVEWSDPAYNPATNLVYVPAVDWCTTFTAFEEARFIPGKLYLGGTFDLDPPDRSQGWLTAVNASTGAVAWKYRSPRPMVASVTTTAGNLLMTGELTGDFVVLNATTGGELYRFHTGGPMGGGIVTYAVGGTQYIAATSGSPSNFWVDQFAGAPTVVVFKLP